MKTEWEYSFDTTDCRFEKVLNFSGQLNKNDESNTVIHFSAKIVPEKDKKRDGFTQSGKLFINLPMPYDEAKPIAEYLAHHLSQEIAFQFGDFTLRGGLILGKNIPESEEEEKELGDAPYFAEVNLVEVRDPVAFDSASFEDISHLPLDQHLLAQHLSARQSKSPIERFLGFFKILESEFSPSSKKETLRESLTNSDVLFQIFSASFQPRGETDIRQSFSEFVDAVVHARHRCAHLRKNKGFGYSPIDSDVKTAVEPYIQPLDILTYETIIHFAKEIYNKGVERTG